MNTNTNRNIARRFATLRTLALLALCTLPTLAASRANADVYADKIQTPSTQYGLPASATALQFHVINSSHSAVNNNKVHITLQTWDQGPTGKPFTFSSASFNLVAYEQKWITVMIPAKANNVTLKGLELKGDAILGTHQYYLDFNDNGAYNPWPQVAPAHLVITSVQTPSTQKNNAPFYITITNTGGTASSRETLKVVQQPWADGPDGPSYTATATAPVLQPNQSVTIQFSAVDYNSDSIEGVIYLNNVFEQFFAFW